MKKEYPEPAWLEVSLEVDQELAEPVASAMGEVIPGGVVMERVFGDIFPEEMDEMVGPVRVYGYLPVDQDLEDRQFNLSRALYYLGRISPLPEPSYQPLKVEDWTTAWQKHYQPIPLGSELIIVPTWWQNPDQHRRPIVMDPGRAFGSGTHPSTQLGLILMEEYLSEHPTRMMFDIGCGSGILSIAGVKLNVGYAFGVDKDPVAVAAATQNAQRNQVDGKTRFAVGSVREIQQQIFEVSDAPLVVANMIVPLLRKLLQQGLVETVSPGGALILSGILASQVHGLISSLSDLDLKILTRRQQGEWIALTLQRSLSSFSC